MRGFHYTRATAQHHFSQDALVSNAEISETQASSDASTIGHTSTQTQALVSGGDSRATDQGEAAACETKELNPGRQLLRHIPQDMWDETMAKQTRRRNLESRKQVNTGHAATPHPLKSYPSDMEQQLRFLLSFQNHARVL